MLDPDVYREADYLQEYYFVERWVDFHWLSRYHLTRQVNILPQLAFTQPHSNYLNFVPIRLQIIETNIKK